MGKQPSTILGSQPKTEAGETIDSYTKLASMLSDYPAHRPPYIGDPGKLTDAQCDDNLADLRAQTAQRLQILSSFLLQHRIDITAAVNGDTNAPNIFTQIHNWLLQWLPQRPMDMVSGDKEPNHPRAKFMASDRSGSEIYLSLFSDLALLEGEAIRITDPRFNWEVYHAPKGVYVCTEEEPDDPPFLASELKDERHICLVRPSDDPEYWPTILNLQVIMRGQCHAMMSPMGYFDHPYGSSFNNALNRRFDKPVATV